MTVTRDILRERLRVIERCFDDLTARAKRNGGLLKRHEAWRQEYLSFPYLLGASDSQVAKRFCDIYLNVMELTVEGKIGLLPVTSEESFMRNFTHLLEEYCARSREPPSAVIRDAKKPIQRYFENGGPVAIKMFDGFDRPKRPFVVKHGRREFLEPMLSSGKIRICPASYYRSDTHNAAIMDDELHRTFFIPTFRERLRGLYHINFHGHRLEFGDNDIALPVAANDYFLFSLCDNVYYRMPTDFGSDAALIITDPHAFSTRLISAFLARWPDWTPHYGPVTYYDPYRDYTKVRVHQLAKHFGYAYQKEVRLAMSANRKPYTALQPEFLEIGPMIDYAILIST